MKLNLKIKRKITPKKEKQRKLQKLVGQCLKKCSMVTLNFTFKIEVIIEIKIFIEIKFIKIKEFYRKTTYVMAISPESCSYIIFFRY